MPKYLTQFTISHTIELEIEADDETEAENKTEEMGKEIVREKGIKVDEAFIEAEVLDKFEE